MRQEKHENDLEISMNDTLAMNIFQRPKSFEDDESPYAPMTTHVGLTLEKLAPNLSSR